MFGVITRNLARSAFRVNFSVRATYVPTWNFMETVSLLNRTLPMNPTTMTIENLREMLEKCKEEVQKQPLLAAQDHVGAQIKTMANLQTISKSISPHRLSI